MCSHIYCRSYNSIPKLIMSVHDQANMNNAILPTNTFSRKEEQCEASSIEDKVYISEIAITTVNAELQGSIWHGKIKENEESTCLDNIKTELGSFQVTGIQNDNVKVEEGINADIKIKFDNRVLYCEHCEAYYKDYCIECGMLVHILNKHALNSTVSGAREDIPNDILEIKDCFGQTGIYALRIIPAGVKFGPFTRLSTTDWPWEIKGEKFVLDRNKWKYLNWMQYVNPTRNTCDGNLHVFQSESNIYFQSTRQIQAGEELLVHFGKQYGNGPNKIVTVNIVTTMKDISMDIFACTFCCLGFSAKSYLAKHKTICVEDTAGKFSIEELTQCTFCKIHLDLKEYLEHHMTFCCERSGRKCIVPSPPAKQATTALNGRKRCLRRIYKCEQCKYRTKYQADLKKHTKQHYVVKMYKCWICNRRFKTKESLTLHVENTHAYVGGKDDQEHATTDYRNTYIKVEQSSSRDQKKMFKCSLCVFRAIQKQSLRIHKEIKHLKELDYKCDTCKYRTNIKSNLERHKKTKHLKVFDYKCDKCGFGANNKSNLEVHIKTKHVMQFDFKCDTCEFKTNRKDHLEGHTKTKHLKVFVYKCDTCEFGANNKSDFKRHIKSKHLNEYDYKCDKCEFGTNSKCNLERHIKTKHLMKFDYKCDSCEYRTNNKSHLERHTKTKHLTKFDYKCDSCNVETNRKDYLEGHIKTKHLKKFDYKCDKCEFKTNIKCNLERHIKDRHLKEFDYKCYSCGYRTNNKSHLERHTKTKHLKI